MRQLPGVVLFDLDGTLVDSAPDLAGTANDMLGSRGRSPLAYSQLRRHAGSGARGMLKAAFGITPLDQDWEALRDEFHDRYEQRMLSLTQVFEGVSDMLGRLDQESIAWGVVTNKAMRFAQPLVHALGLRPQVLVAGDSTPHRKPHPAPLLLALKNLGRDPSGAVYVGDDLRDMQAARAAHMQGWAAAWGYLGEDSPLADWGMDRSLSAPRDVLKFLS